MKGILRETKLQKKKLLSLKQTQNADLSELFPHNDIHHIAWAIFTLKLFIYVNYDILCLYFMHNY